MEPSAAEADEARVVRCRCHHDDVAPGERCGVLAVDREDRRTPTEDLDLDELVGVEHQAAIEHHVRRDGRQQQGAMSWRDHGTASR